VSAEQIDLKNQKCLKCELSSHQELIAYIEARVQNFAIYDV